ALRRVPDRMREAARHPFEVGENPIAPLVMEAVEGGGEKFAVIHHETWNGNWPDWLSLFRAFPGLMSSRNPGFDRAVSERPGCARCLEKVDPDQHAGCGFPHGGVFIPGPARDGLE